jgi:hypothetical protein
MVMRLARRCRTLQHVDLFDQRLGETTTPLPM